ncbi:hypothetical protein FOZ60_009477 [Perkinsus olseni]|uniref:Uncharacterized protein n=1 Tax=Perkinsus olseni TaxID=32597 RepID=A0A7J6NH92_PEROL|nr:hypothetical protein FOZ60_009477 [Perkinsus olseni]
MVQDMPQSASPKAAPGRASVRDSLAARAPQLKAQTSPATPPLADVTPLSIAVNQELALLAERAVLNSINDREALVYIFSDHSVRSDIAGELNVKGRLAEAQGTLRSTHRAGKRNLFDLNAPDRNHSTQLWQLREEAILGVTPTRVAQP